MNTTTVGALLIALVRTVVPVVVGAAIATLASWGLVLPEETAVLLHALLVAVFTAAYYTLVRLLSAKWAWFGWLLGYPADPAYAVDVATTGKHVEDPGEKEDAVV